MSVYIVPLAPGQSAVSVGTAGPVDVLVGVRSEDVEVSDEVIDVPVSEDEDVLLLLLLVVVVVLVVLVVLVVMVVLV